MIIQTLLTGIGFIFACLCLISCEVESKDEILNKLDEEYHLYDYYVDEYGNEGIVCSITYPSSNKDKYPKGYSAVMVVSCDEAYLPWGPMGEYFTDLDSVRFFTKPDAGIAMLQSMYARGIEKYPAQEWCFKKNKNHEINGNGWRLPTWNEMSSVTGEDINKAILSVGGTLINNADGKYWVCQTSEDNYADIYNFHFKLEGHGINENNLKKNYNHVRAIKYIYYCNPN